MMIMRPAANNPKNLSRFLFYFNFFFSENPQKAIHTSRSYIPHHLACVCVCVLQQVDLFLGKLASVINIWTFKGQTNKVARRYRRRFHAINRRFFCAAAGLKKTKQKQKQKQTNFFFLHFWVVVVVVRGGRVNQS